MPPSIVPTPAYVRSFAQDLTEVFLLLFVYFIGSLLIWPVALSISFLFIPLTFIGRRLLLVCCLPCTCNHILLRCTCRVFATTSEALWIGEGDQVLTHQQMKSVLLSQQSVPASPAETTAQPLISEADLHTADSITTNVHSLVLVVEQCLDVTVLINQIEHRITQLTVNDSNQKYFPRFTQCLVKIAGGSLVWVDDPNFSLAKHVTIHPTRVTSQQELEQLLGSKAKEGLPTARPLWQLVVATGYGTLDDTVLLWRFHGSVYDGVTIAKVLAYALGNPQSFTFRPHHQYFQRHDHILKFLLTGPMRFLGFLLKRKRRRQCENSSEGASAVHSFTWSERYLNQAILLKNKMLLNMSCNDLLLSLLSGALYGFHPNAENELTSLADQVIGPHGSVLIPFDMGSNKRKSKRLPLGNNLIMLPCDMATNPEMVPRLWCTEVTFSKLKSSGDTRVQLYTLNWLNSLPFSHSLCRRLHRHLRGDCLSLFTSFNGPKVVDYLASASLRDIMFFTSPPEGVKYSFNFISYSGTIKLTTNSLDGEISADTVDKLIVNMAAQMTELDRMVFQRYFPDGLRSNICPYVHGQSSRAFTEFMNRLREIDDLSQEYFCQPATTCLAPSSDDVGNESGAEAMVNGTAEGQGERSDAPKLTLATQVNTETSEDSTFAVRDLTDDYETCPVIPDSNYEDVVGAVKKPVAGDLPTAPRQKALSMPAADMIKLCKSDSNLINRWRSHNLIETFRSARSSGDVSMRELDIQEPSQNPSLGLQETAVTPLTNGLSAVNGHDENVDKFEEIASKPKIVEQKDNSLPVVNGNHVNDTIENLAGDDSVGTPEPT